MFQSEKIRQQYEQRKDRYLTAMGGGTPDRVPIRFLLQEAAARICGQTNQAVAIDCNAAFDCTRRAGQLLDCDAVMLNAIWSNYSVGKAAGWKYLHVPGVDVGMDSVLQFSEPSKEEDLFLREEEYDEFTDDPTAFLVGKWMSRATNTVASKGAPVTFEHNASLLSGALAYANYMNAFSPAADKLKYEAGIVSANAGMIKAPLDLLMDKFRGFVPTVLDAMEKPETVRKACEALIPHIIANALGGADPNKEVPITLWAHRGCVPFITPEIFDKIYWPTLLPVLEALFAKGYQVLFYAEGNWEAHYDTLRTLPSGSIIYHLDKGSPEYAAKKLKDRFAVSGGLDYNVLANGEPEDVRRYVARLFDCLKPDGGYILDASALMLSDIGYENLRAAVDYTMEHGFYSRTQAAPARPTVKAPVIDLGKRAPNTVRPWEQESAAYPALSGDVEGVKAAWEKNDAALYNYLWTTVLW